MVRALAGRSRARVAGSDPNDGEPGPSGWPDARVAVRDEPIRMPGLAQLAPALDGSPSGGLVRTFCIELVADRGRHIGRSETCPHPADPILRIGGQAVPRQVLADDQDRLADPPQPLDGSDACSSGRGASAPSSNRVSAATRILGGSAPGPASAGGMAHDRRPGALGGSSARGSSTLRT